MQELGICISHGLSYLSSKKAIALASAVAAVFPLL